MLDGSTKTVKERETAKQNYVGKEKKKKYMKYRCLVLDIGHKLRHTVPSHALLSVHAHAIVIKYSTLPASSVPVSK